MIPLLYYVLFTFGYNCNVLSYKKPSSVPEVLRPLYESSTALAQKTTMAVRVPLLSILFLRKYEFPCRYVV